MNLVECGGVLYEVPSQEPDDFFPDELEYLDEEFPDWESPFGECYDFQEF